MLVVFSESSREDLAQNLGIATWYGDFRNENLEYCIRRERAQEILACRAMKIPYVVLAEPPLLSQALEDTIIDTNCEIDALNPSTPLVLRLRGTVPLPQRLRIFPLLVSQGFAKQIEQWPNHIVSPEIFLKRQVLQMSQSLFSESFLSGELTTPIFLKSVRKSDLHHVINSPLELNGVIKTVHVLTRDFPSLAHQAKGLPADHVVALHQLQDWDCPYRGPIKGCIKVIDLSDGVIISSVMNIVREPDHRGEYRAFIINGEVSSLSAYRDYDHTVVPAQITEFAGMFAEHHRDVAPAYVADFCLSDRGPMLIEMNDLTYSGRYIDNDPGLLYCDLERFAGVDRSVVCEPRIAVPAKAETFLPETDRVAVDFGEPASAFFFGQLDRPEESLKESPQASVAERFKKAMIEGHSIDGAAQPAAEHFKLG